MRLLMFLHQNPRVSRQISSLVILMSRLSIYEVQSHLQIALSAVVEKYLGISYISEMEIQLQKSGNVVPVRV